MDNGIFITIWFLKFKNSKENALGFCFMFGIESSFHGIQQDC